MKYDINTVTSCNTTSLITAINNGRTDIAIILIHNKINLNTINGWKQTAFSVACVRGYEDVVIELIKYGVDYVDHIDEYVTDGGMPSVNKYIKDVYCAKLMEAIDDGSSDMNKSFGKFDMNSLVNIFVGYIL